ncbi:MAG: hypothetical protein V9F82_07335, partial [Dermatophilaceae bacterium]
STRLTGRRTSSQSRRFSSAIWKRLAKLEIAMTITDEALTELAKAGFDPMFGARPLKRAIQERIENTLARQILEGKFAAGDKVVVDARNGVISFARPS